MVSMKKCDNDCSFDSRCFDHNIFSVNDHKQSALQTTSTWNERLHSRSIDHVNQNIDLVKSRSLSSFNEDATDMFSFSFTLTTGKRTE